MRELEPGLEFLPHLTLVQRLGRGGMAEAWLARDRSRGEEVVAKILPADAPEERVALLRREARLVRKLRHPNIVPVYGFEAGPHGSAVVSRHMTGGDAGRLRGGDTRAVVRLGREVAEALQHLHGLGVVHRDVKPTNVLLDESGRAHLADFGIAAVARPHDGEDGVVVHGGGSRASMSPQQRAGETAQPADDVYALGVLLHDLLAGRPPFSATATDEEIRTRPAPSLGASVPEALRELVDSMLAKSPEGRPRDMGAVGEALRGIEETLAPEASPVPRPADVRLQPPPRVPEVGVVAAAPARPVAPVRRERTRAFSPERVLLLGSLAVAVLFVILVLPRLAERRTAPAAAPETAPPASTEEAVAAAEAPPPEATPTPPPEAPDERVSAPAFAEAAPPPPPRARTPEAAPAAAGSRPRGRPASSSDGEEADRQTREQFAAAMSEAHDALDRGDWGAARQGLARAAALQPASPAVADVRRRIEEAERSEALGRHRERARDLEAKEDWHRALAEYEAALKLDPAVAFALEGRDRTTKRGSLADKLDFHIGHPLRLATDSVAREAEVALQQAREVEAPGPRHQKQVTALDRALVEMRTPVAVVLESDGQTEIVVHKVGRLGTFERRTLELRPGTYTIVGSRGGYRDVRRQLVVKPAAAPPPLVVRCEEAI